MLLLLQKGASINDVRFKGGMGGSEMTPKNWTLEGKNRTLGGDGGSKIVKNRRTSLMDAPLCNELQNEIAVS